MTIFPRSSPSAHPASDIWPIGERVFVYSAIGLTIFLIVFAVWTALSLPELIDPRGKPYFWIGEEYFNNSAADGTDYNAIELGYISVTPLKSDMTDHRALTAIESWRYLKDPELLHKT